MPLNKQNGNMYGFVSHTWNPVGGECKHDCVYCYMKNSFLGGKKYEGEPYLVQKELKTNLGKGNVIFVGSATDIFQEATPDDIIEAVLDHCNRYPDNEYILQTKNPARFQMFDHSSNIIYTTTLESNREQHVSEAPTIAERVSAMKHIHGKTMITIEPILDFDLPDFVAMIKGIRPSIVTIGADSGNNDLPEPSPEKIRSLVEELQQFTEVRIKHNLKRLTQ